MSLGPACTRPPSRPADSGTAPLGGPPALTRLAPGSADWPLGAAVSHLGDKDLAPSAALRLVRLAERHPLWAPPELSDDTFARLRCVGLAEGLWAAGVADRAGAGVLHAPVLIDSAGEVTALAEGTEEELLILVVSADADVFPHLLIAPLRVWMVQAEPHLVLTLDSPPEAGLQWRPQGGAGHIVLMVRGPDGWAEAARYAWDPYELMFTGPAAGPLPDPPGGRFELDLAQSPLLIPRGGEIPKPKPRPLPPPPPRYRPGQDA